MGRQIHSHLVIYWTSACSLSHSSTLAPSSISWTFRKVQIKHINPKHKLSKYCIYLVNQHTMQVGSAYPLHGSFWSWFMIFVILCLHKCNDESTEIKINIQITVSKFKSKVQTWSFTRSSLYSWFWRLNSAIEFSTSLTMSSVASYRNFHTNHFIQYTRQLN